MKDGKFFAGIDIGSLSSEALILKDDRVLSYHIMKTGAHPEKTAKTCVDVSLKRAGISVKQLSCIVATGYGRASFTFADKQITEITCHARGAHYLFPSTRTVIDIGGQDSKVITIDGDGSVTDFVMNDRCSAGTGRFLEVMAKALDMEVEEMGMRAIRVKSGIPISSMCTVFAESEVVSLIGDGKDPNRILRGICEAISKRIFGMAGRLRIKEEITFTGGVAKNQGIVHCLSLLFKKKMNIPNEPQIVGALGAGLCARDLFLKGKV